jgi:3-hydroxyisobutyrate dehydrogenase-like beta-hydroxyacid dehydrogenase
MTGAVAIIGFGEAGMALAPPGARGFDVREDHQKRADFDRCGVRHCDTATEALADASVVLSLVTADQALAAARAAAPHLQPNALWLDGNSVAPDTKRAAADAIESAGARYVDVAIMAPVHPARFAVPLILAGPHAGLAETALRTLGFTDLRIVAGPLGSAAAIKMIRSVMIKGIEALSVECALAGDAAGVLPDVLSSLGGDWPARFDYNLDRMMVHGTRRSAEMGEVVATLDALGTGSAMARATQARQAELGTLGIAPQPGLDAKLTALRPSRLAEQPHDH